MITVNIVGILSACMQILSTHTVNRDQSEIVILAMEKGGSIYYGPALVAVAWSLSPLLCVCVWVTKALQCHPHPPRLQGFGSVS